MQPIINCNAVKTLLGGTPLFTKHPLNNLYLRIVLSQYSHNMIYIYRCDHHHNLQSFSDIMFALCKCQMMGYRIKTIWNHSIVSVTLEQISSKAFLFYDKQ